MTRQPYRSLLQHGTAGVELARQAKSVNRIEHLSRKLPIPTRPAAHPTSDRTKEVGSITTYQGKSENTDRLGHGPAGAPEWAATSALVSAAAGLFSGIFLVLFFTIGQPLGATRSGWAWFGPANDLASALHAGGLIPVALALRERMARPDVNRWTVIGVSGMAIATVLPIALVLGLLPFAVQAPLVSAAIAVVFAWLYAISRAGARRGILSRSVATVGTVTSIAFGTLAVAAGLVALLPAQSTARTVATVLAAAAAVIAWIGFPVWTISVRSKLRPLTDPPAAAPAQD